MRILNLWRLSVSGRNQIVFTPLEELVIERSGAYDCNTTRGKLDILSGKFKDLDIEEAVVSVIEKLGRIYDQSYADMYYVGQRRQEEDKGRSPTARTEKARAASEKRNEGRAVISKVRRKGMEI